MIYKRWEENYGETIADYLAEVFPSVKPRSCCDALKVKLHIKKVIFNMPATIILWSDNTKTVVKCQEGDEYDCEKGFVMAYLKKLLGNDNTFNKEINKWVWGE